MLRSITFRSTIPAALAAALLLPACADPPAAPRASAATLGRDGGTVTLPMKVEATMHWIVTGATAADCPDLIDPGTNEIFTAEGWGEGTATHLGRFDITRLDHPTVNFCSLRESPPAPPGPEDLHRTGEFEFRAADGSTLSGTYEFLFLPPEQGGFFTALIEGGTGRMAGASGRLEVDFQRSGVTRSDDPLFLEEATLDPAVLVGRITLPRP